MKWGIQAICILLLLGVAVTGAYGMSLPVSSLPAGCTIGSTSCTKISDVTSGTCRTIKYSTSAGTIQEMVCDKGSAYELYKQAAPNVDFTSCTGGGCVDKNTGFVRFTSTSLSTRTRAVSSCIASTEVCDGKDNDCNGQIDENNVCGTVTPPTVTSTAPLVSPSSIGFNGQTRDQNYETLVDSWFRSPNVIQKISTSQGTALWVPWMKSSSSSQASDLQSGSNCAIGTVDLQNNCLVTDEFSQVGMVLAMSKTHQADFDQWVTTLKMLKSSKYGSLPVWRASRSSNGVSTAITGNQDSASDADARAIIALYTAASNDAFTSTQKASYKALADTMAADMIKNDFVHTSKPGRNGVMINNWLASGSVAGNGGDLTWGDFSYGGYYGDVTIALLAAYKSTGNQAYLTYAKDTVNTYLLAANYNGASFSVPPKAFKWDVSGATPKAVCTNNCGASAWDDSDAVRATSMCKAVYYGSLNNVDLGTDLKSYCQSWLSSGGVQTSAYSIQYTFSGAPASPTVGGMYENGLGASLNFNQKQTDLVTRLNEVGTHYDVTRGTFDYSASDGIYRSAFFKVNLGSAIGRDMNAFAGSGTTMTTTPTCTPTTEVCDGVDNNCNGAVDENNVCAAPAPTTTTTGVAGLSVKCTTSGSSCSLVSDSNDGSCRTIKYNSGSEQVMICDKTTAYEMYSQAHSGDTSVCVGTNCVGSATGYARWTK